MPRKTAEAIIAERRVHDATPHLRPRDGLSTDVRKLFVDIVTSNPVDHFRPTDAHLLEQFCVAILTAQEAAAALAKDGPVIGGKASAWIVVQEKSIRSMVALSMRLRLSPQSRLDPKTSGRAQAKSLSFYEMEALHEDAN